MDDSEIAACGGTTPLDGGNSVTDAQKLIAEVVRAHPLGVREWSDGYRHTSCMCPQEVGANGHADHVAAEIDKALGGLTPIWSDVVVDDDGFTYPHWNEWHDERGQSQKAVHDNPGTVLGTAFMSGWSEVVGGR